MSVLCVQGVSETQSFATRTTSTQRYAGEGGFRVGMTRRLRLPIRYGYQERKRLDHILNTSKIQEVGEN